MIDFAISLAERGLLPDRLIRAGMRRFMDGIEKLPPVSDAAFADRMADRAIAEHTAAANAQHYELPPEFFAAFLGPRRKYSCCWYPTGNETLAQAEDFALAETASHAGLFDGQRILELGCGWGSLSLWMAERFPHASITAVSNSVPQRRYIQARAKARGLANLTVITADMNVFVPDGIFDRIVSVEMFEHMANWRPLLERLRANLAPQGRLFLHIFTHRDRPSYYAPDDDNWMARHFFTGGIMPSAGLVRQFPDLFAVEQEWRWSGANYQRTALQWLENYDANRGAILPILGRVYGAEAMLWNQRWRMFLLATAESFGYAGGRVWDVRHYRLAPVGGH
jgi:cyclopropane-fatty-acyl-phospholipid synthase